MGPVRRLWQVTASVTEVTSSPLDRADLRTRVDHVLGVFLARQRALLDSVDPALSAVADAIDELVLRGGKRLRPAFAYWGCRAAGGADTDEVVATVAALELVQASALIHDDVMDDSDTRRGGPTAHRRFSRLHEQARWLGDAASFGTGSAIVLGDLCLVWSDEMLHGGGLDATAVARTRPVFDRMRTEVTVGQYLDLHTQASGDTSTYRASLVAQYKSAKYTVERPLLIGAAIADAPDMIIRVFSAYGLPLGEAFQLRDDVLGVFGDPAVTGKPAGDDLREGKRTYLVAEAFANAGSAARQELTADLGNPDLTGQGIDRLRDIITTTGALARTEQRITELTDTAVAALDARQLTADGMAVLTELAVAATRRTG